MNETEILETVEMLLTDDPRLDSLVHILAQECVRLRGEIYRLEREIKAQRVLS